MSAGAQDRRGGVHVLPARDGRGVGGGEKRVDPFARDVAVDEDLGQPFGDVGGLLERPERE